MLYVQGRPHLPEAAGNHADTAAGSDRGPSPSSGSALGGWPADRGVRANGQNDPNKREFRASQTQFPRFPARYRAPTPQLDPMSFSVVYLGPPLKARPPFVRLRHGLYSQPGDHGP